MAQNSQRNKRRGPAKGPTGAAAGPSQDRYAKFLPEWMKGANGAPPRRPAGPRRARPARSVGGYTPGKFGGNAND